VSTTVKISKDYKDRLDRLQASLLIATGKKISLQELLEMLVELGAELEDELQNRVSGEHVTLDAEAVSRIFNMSSDWGIETDEESLDKTLYGGST